MNRIFADADVGRKNIGFGIGLFLLLGVVVGMPLSIDFFGGSLLSGSQYQTWKVVHGYGVFLAFINYFCGLCIDRLNLTREQKEFTSWSFLLAGLTGGGVRMILVLLSALSTFGIYASLVETVLFVLGTFMFVRGQVTKQSSNFQEQTANARYLHAK
jgi:hypothetical protein